MAIGLYTILTKPSPRRIRMGGLLIVKTAAVCASAIRGRDSRELQVRPPRYSHTI